MTDDYGGNYHPPHAIQHISYFVDTDRPPPIFYYLLSEVAAFAAAQIMPTKAILLTTSATL